MTLMNTGIRWKKYKKKDDYSYSFGPFPTMELLEKRREAVVEILISPSFNYKDELVSKLEDQSIPYSIGDKQISRLAPKGNTFVVGVFRKFSKPVVNQSHLVLDQVRDMGNLGNICRTMLGLGLQDLVLIGNCCDIYNPRTVRASMGAIFSIRFTHYPSFEAYRTDFGGNRSFYAFMLDSKAQPLPQVEVKRPYSLIFGNEGAGLNPTTYRDKTQAVMIPQSEAVDSLNLTTACAIALYHFQNF